MKYNRDEPFRFTFTPPISGFFSITRLRGVNGQSRKGQMELLDISPRGVKFQSILDIPKSTDMELVLTFSINEEEFIRSGNIVWKQEGYKKHTYGFIFHDDPIVNKRIIEELKKYNKSKKV